MQLVLFFDGECGFCQRAVRVVFEMDKKGVVDFAPLQGQLARAKGLRKYAEKEGGSMVVLRESDGALFYKSDAWIELGKALGGVWALFARSFSIFPKHGRDKGYDLVAKNRYKVSGKKSACRVPSKELRERMRK